MVERQRNGEHLRGKLNIPLASAAGNVRGLRPIVQAKLEYALGISEER